MNEPTEIKKTIDSINTGKIKYDASVKKLLANKQVLARILKYLLPEFMDMEIPDVMNSIGNNISISNIPIDPGLTNSEFIKQETSEDSVLNEGVIYFDIRFTAFPNGIETKMIINVEAQKSSRVESLKYHIHNRMNFYLCRLVSSQKGQEFYKSQYDLIKPVRSIWICMDEKNMEGSIEKIRQTSEMVYGTSKEQCHPNMLEGYILRIPFKNKAASENKLIQMLEDLLAESSANEKIAKMKNDHGFIMNVELEEDINVMCNLSDLLLENAEKEKEELEISSIIKIMKNANLSASEAMDILEIPEEKRAKCVSAIEKLGL